jgi:DNA-binding IclR family transcriptional regulator
MRVQDIAQQANKSRQAVHKLLQKLCGLGALAQDEVGKYYAPQQVRYPVGYDAPVEPPWPQISTRCTHCHSSSSSVCRIGYRAGNSRDIYRDSQCLWARLAG